MPTRQRPPFRFQFLSPSAVLLLALLCGSQSLRAAATPDEFEKFALQNQGSATAGQALFQNPAKAICSMCHSIDGSSSKAGPDLGGIGDKFSKPDLIKSVLQPSSAIAVGYGTTVVTKKSGETVAGVIKQATADWLELMGADGKAVRVPTGEISGRQELAQSLMPESLQATLSLEEFSDLIAYMGSLKRPQESISGGGAEIPAARASVGFEPFAGASQKFDAPLWFGEILGPEGRFMVLEHFGNSWILEKDAAGTDKKTPFLDLRNVVRRGGATGLLAMAFHPDFLKNRKYYLKYQIEEQGRISTLVVERVFDAEFKGDGGTEARVLMKIPGVTQDHSGGSMTFGPDGFLYIGMGDTGPQRDPQGHGQDMNLLLGKILRIDVDHASAALPYGIPESNPFRGQQGTRPEIWARGCREPWRISFDSTTRDLWVGDVGQDRFEEVGIVRVGENHGWNVIEGMTPFSDRYKKEGAEFVPPVFSYPHSIGVSVTGGYVYRGTKAPKMQGWYIFADYESRRVWALTQKDRKLEKLVEIGRAPSRAVSFGEDRHGELYLCGYDDGIIYKLNLEKVDPSPLRTLVLSPTAEKGPVPWKHTFQEPHEGWQRPDFDDSSWVSTPGGFGTPNTPAAVIRTEWKTADIWLRREFIVPETPGEHVLAWRAHHDEDAEFYLNGIETTRQARWTQGYVTIKLSPDACKALKPGKNVIAIHCHQVSGGQYIDAGLIEYVDSAK